MIHSIDPEKIYDLALSATGQTEKDEHRTQHRWSTSNNGRLYGPPATAGECQIRTL
jgi:hypothetical protein